MPVLRVRPAPYRRGRLLAVLRRGRRPGPGGVGPRRDRGVHAGWDRPGAAGDGVLRPGPGREAARPGDARPRLLPDGDRQRHRPHRPVRRGLPDQGARGRPRVAAGHRGGDPRRRGAVGAHQGEAPGPHLDRDRQHRAPARHPDDVDDDVRPRRQPASLGRPSPRPQQGAGPGPRGRRQRFHRVRAAPLRAHELADLPRRRRPPRTDASRQPRGPRHGPHPPARQDLQHPDQLGQARCRGHPRHAPRRLPTTSAAP